MDMDNQDKVGGNNNSLPAEVSTDELELLKKLEEANRWEDVIWVETDVNVNIIVITVNTRPGGVVGWDC